MAKKPDTGALFDFGNSALKHLQKYGVDGLVFTVGVIAGFGALILRADPTAVVLIYVLSLAAFLFGREREAGRQERAAERELDRLRLTELAPVQERARARLRNHIPLVPAPAQKAPSSEGGEANA